MSFLAPHRFAALWGVAVLSLVYLGLARRRRHYALRFTNLDLLASLAPKRPGWRRHLPAAVTLAALAVLVVGFARPVRSERVPKEGATIVLAIDTSRSMGATDVTPTRLAAAQRAAVDFVNDLPEGLRLGLVSFDAAARVLVPPTTEREPVIHGLESLVLAPGTATGEAVFAALGAIQAAAGPPGRDEPPDDDSAARIILMSDGRQTTGRPLGAAAETAREANVPVWTIAYGTAAGTIESDGRVIAVPSDPPAMRELASVTEGRFSEAASDAELRRIYDGIGSSIGYTTEQREYTATLVAAALVLLAAASLAGLFWSARIL